MIRRGTKAQLLGLLREPFTGNADGMGGVLQTVGAVLIAVVGWGFLIDAYRQRSDGERPTVWLSRGVDPDNWPWWIPALGAVAFSLVAVGHAMDRGWWGLLGLPMAAVLVRTAVLRKKGLPTRSSRTE